MQIDWASGQVYVGQSNILQYSRCVSCDVEISMVGSGLQAHLFALFTSQDHSLKQIDIVNKNCFLTIPDMIPDTHSDPIQEVSH